MGPDAVIPMIWLVGLTLGVSIIGLLFLILICSLELRKRVKFEDLKEKGEGESIDATKSHKEPDAVTKLFWNLDDPDKS